MHSREIDLPTTILTGPQDLLRYRRCKFARKLSVSAHAKDDFLTRVDPLVTT
jgi:hypothetical protein